MSAFFYSGLSRCWNRTFKLYISSKAWFIKSKKTEKVQGNKIITPAKAKLNPNELLISKILDKYPDFDPNWSSDVQKSWMEGMIKLYDGIN